VCTDASAASCCPRALHTVAVWIRSTRCGMAHATGVATPGNKLVLPLGQPPEGSVVEAQTPRGPWRVLARVLLGAAACCPACDALLTLTMWTPACDACHEPSLLLGAVKTRLRVPSISVHLHI
jgi:hypothetical protein